MEIHVVHKTVGGYAREDADKSTVVGAYTDPEQAELVALASSGHVQTVQVDVIPPGYAQRLLDLGYILE